MIINLRDECDMCIENIQTCSTRSEREIREFMHRVHNSIMYGILINIRKQQITVFKLFLTH